MKKTSTRYRHSAAVLCAFLVSTSLIFGGCDTKVDEPENAEEPNVIASGNEEKTEESEQKTGSVTVTRTIYGTDIEITAHPIQVKDDIAALELEYKLLGEVNPFLGNKVSLLTILGGGQEGVGAKNIRLIDFESKQVYQQLRAAKNPGLFTTGGFANPNESTSFAVNALSKDNPVAKSITLYPAPKNENISILIPNLGLISNVPVTQADRDYDFASYIEVAGEPFLDNIESEKNAFREYLQDYTDEIAVIKKGSDVTVTISSDVLFDTDKYELNSEANAAIDKAIDKIRASYDGGIIRIVGHTDDVDSDEYNQTLSENRAVAVADVIQQELGANFTLETLGKGETEPISPGTSEDDRAANRRVDITFNEKIDEGEFIETKMNSEIPTTEMPTGSGNGWVEYSNGLHTTFRVRVLKMIRAEGALIGYFELGHVSHTDKTGVASLERVINDYPGSGSAMSKRGFNTMSKVYGVHSLSLLTPEGRLFPYDYAKSRESYSGEEEDTWSRLLGDDSVYNVTSKENEETPTLLITLIWPDTGQDRVTVDVETRFRIENVEVDNNPEAINEKY